MADSKFITAPIKTDKMPTGIPYIIATEAAERFSYYGMSAILAVFMTQYLRNSSGAPDLMTENEANQRFHEFAFLGYFLPFVGAILADAFIGKFRTILFISVIYCGGHLALAIDDTRTGLAIGMVLIAIGMGGIKPCVSAMVGDQFGASNQHLLSKAFGWFYFAINSGSLVAFWLTPLLLKYAGPRWAFGVPGVFMAVAAIIFWSGRYRFVHVPPTGGPLLKMLFSLGAVVMGLRFLLIARLAAGTWVLTGLLLERAGIQLQEVMGGIVQLIPAAGIAWLLFKILPRPKLGSECAESWRTIGRIAMIYVFVAIFWSLWSQCQSEWVLQAEKMDRHLSLFGWNFEVLSSQMQLLSGIFILLMIVVCNYVLYPLINRFWPLNELRKIGLGLVVTCFSFLVIAWIESQIGRGLKPYIGWQVPAFLLLSTGETMVSVTSLEFAYTQAPKRLKAVIMILYLWAIAFGNFLTARIHGLIANADGTSKLPGASFYLFFVALCAAAAVIYAFVSRFYTLKTHLQDEAPAA